MCKMKNMICTKKKKKKQLLIDSAKELRKMHLTNQLETSS